MTTIRLTAAMLDGREVSSSTTTYMCAADRIAFERRFHMGSAALAEWQTAFDEDGKPKPGADLGALHEEWVYFFSWRALKRQTNGQLPEDFDVFCDSVAEMRIETVDEANPTTAAQPSTS